MGTEGWFEMEESFVATSRLSVWIQNSLIVNVIVMNMLLKIECNSIIRGDECTCAEDP